MAQEYLNTRIVIRNDSQAEWEANNDKILLKGELGIEFADGKAKVKVGDGEKTWGNLDYFGGEEAKNFQVNSLDEITETNLAVGDTAIVKTVIYEDANNASNNKYSYTAYVYNGTGWAAMDGNYNASNVYFDEDITYTANVGAVQLESGKSSGTFNAKGKSLEEVLKAIMALTKDPTITDPTFSMTVGRTTDTNNLELGSKIKTFTWSGTYTDGNYEYGHTLGSEKAANCVDSYSVSCNVAGTKSGNTKSGTWTITNPITIDSPSSKVYGTITNTCSYATSTRIPVNNIGDAVDGQIQGDTITQEKNISLTGYREGFFYGSLTTAKAPSALTSSDIRSLSKSGAKYASGKKTYTVPVGAAMVIFACPSANTGVTDILNTTVNAGMNDAFGLSAPTKINVEGANGYTAEQYNVWTFTPAEPYGSTAALSITLG